MKKIKLKIQQYLINKIIGYELELLLHEKANVIDVINEVDKIINSKGDFPLKDYHSLLHMMYNPVEERFYKQTAITAYAVPRLFLNVRNNPKMELPNGAMVFLMPEGPCITAGEEVLDYKIFCEAISRYHS